MEKLDTLQTNVIELVIKGESFSMINKRLGIHNSRTVFLTARNKIQRGKGTAPDPAILNQLPFSQTEWRADSRLSLQIVSQHQKACDAAVNAYWKAFGTLS